MPAADEETLPLAGREASKEEFWRALHGNSYVPTREEFEIFWAAQQVKKREAQVARSYRLLADYIEIQGKRYFQEDWWQVCQRVSPDMPRQEFDRLWQQRMDQKFHRDMLMRDPEVSVIDPMTRLMLTNL